MAQKPNNLPLILFAVVAIGGLVGLNLMNQKNDPKIQESIAKDAEREAQKKQADAAAKTPPPPPATPMVAEANDVVAWGSEKTFGTPGGKPAVVIGWSWTPAVQGNPSSVYTALTAAQSGFPKATIRVVNLDAKPGAAAPGISVDGAVRVQPMPDGTFPDGQQLMSTMMRPGAAPVPKTQ